jgi:hypothetical protein
MEQVNIRIILSLDFEGVKKNYRIRIFRYRMINERAAWLKGQEIKTTMRRLAKKRLSKLIYDYNICWFSFSVYCRRVTN